MLICCPNKGTFGAHHNKYINSGNSYNLTEITVMVSDLGK